MKCPGIIATIGPSSRSFAVLKEMKGLGMNVGRINTKYGGIKQHEIIENHLRKLGCKIMYDVVGIKKMPWLKARKFDYLAVSFAESAAQVNKMRKLVGKKVKIISKIETRKGVRRIKEIITASDGVMVARGDLGDHISLETLPIYQKLIIKECKRRRVMVITATEMLLSMTKSQIPERAEVSDVANAVLDGSDYLMLSEETAIGKYPVLAVEMMRHIIGDTVRLRNHKL